MNKRSLLFVALVTILVATGYLAGRNLLPDPKSSRNGKIPSFAALTPIGLGARFEPCRWAIEPRECLQGELVPLDVVIRNDNAQPVNLTGLSGTCGCMKFMTDGQPVKLPYALAPNATLPIQVEIDTRDRGGLQRFRLSLLNETQVQQTLSPQSLEIHLRIRVPFVPMPADAYIEFESDQINAAHHFTFVLHDGWPGTGLTIKDITGTAPGRLTWQTEPLTGEAILGVTKLKRRCAVKVTYRPAPGVEEFTERLTITPSDPRAAPVVLKVWGKVLQPYSLTPRQLVFHNRSPNSARTVFCQFRKPAYNAVRIVSLPAFIKGEVKPTDGQRSQLEFRCAYPAAPGKHEGEVVLETEPTKERLALPVTVYVER